MSTVIRNKQIVVPTGAKPASPISAAIKVGSFLFISGQVGKDPKTGKVPGDKKEQIRLMFENVESLLKDAGAGMQHVVKTTVYLSDLKDREKYLNALWTEYFPKEAPTRTCVQAGLGEYIAEMDAITIIP